MVNEFKEGTHNTIDLNVENSKAEEIIIQGVRPISSINNETYLWIKNKERELIYVYGVLLPSNVEKKEALFNEGVSYIPISANGAIRLYHVKIEADLNTITRCGIYSGGKIEISASEINGLLACDNLEKVSNSFIQNSTLAHNIQIVEDCFLKDYEAPANIKTLIGFNSEKSEHKEEIQPINAKILKEPDLL